MPASIAWLPKQTEITSAKINLFHWRPTMAERDMFERTAAQQGWHERTEIDVLLK